MAPQKKSKPRKSFIGSKGLVPRPMNLTRKQLKKGLGVTKKRKPS